MADPDQTYTQNHTCPESERNRDQSSRETPQSPPETIQSPTETPQSPPETLQSLDPQSPPETLQSPDPQSPPETLQSPAKVPQTSTETKTKEDSEDPKTTEETQIPEYLKEYEDPDKPEEEEPLGPDDVVCDSCMETPRRAVKSCLTCLVSYCQPHLRPHLENPKFQNHRLLEPLRDIERRTCETHKRPLELFCQADSHCVCQDCVSEDHRGHKTVPVEEARHRIQKELMDKQTEMKKTVAAAENAINKLQVNTVCIENSVSEVRSVISSSFDRLQASVEKAKKEVTEILEGEEQQALKQAQGIRVHLEHRCTDLKKTQAQVDRITRNHNHVDFLQEYSEWRKEAADVSLPGVSIGLTDSLASFSRVIVDSTDELCRALVSSYAQKLKQTCSNDKMGIKTTVQAIVAAKHNMSLPDPVTHDDFLKYSALVSFDGQTAHKFLRLTEDNQKVTNTTPWQHPYADVPERFEHWRQVLASESFYLGRHYFEADISGEGTHVGVTYKSIDRKGSESNCCITGNNFSWCLQWNGRTFSAWHGDVETPLSVQKFTRIGIYVDYTRGLLAFYGIGDGVTLIHRYEAEFLEPLYPAFWLSKKENVVALVVPGEPLRLKSPSPPTSPANGALVSKVAA
ncbi:tripartite motif-containing protein 16 [Sphaeramia orbicularis]|uniref:Tripartite motif-containing protein 16-like protein n=1 Tax=Sphaeramia orbicularis TaxID=375764 RepID=A0A672YCK0_9TELE|nr:tripartite motif-containing protein 16-like protein [Sphaeramia orbicularis]XP_029986308.1 tripartite motif-containing protein 16-like protein [Sphaeramia orbicularis]